MGAGASKQRLGERVLAARKKLEADLKLRQDELIKSTTPPRRPWTPSCRAFGFCADGDLCGKPGGGAAGAGQGVQEGAECADSQERVRVVYAVRVPVERLDVYFIMCKKSTLL